MKFNFPWTVAYSSLIKSEDISVENNARSKLPTVCLPKSDTVEKKKNT